MADLVIGYLQNIMLHVIDHMRSGEVLHEEAVHEALHMPMFDDNWETHASRCQIDFDFKSLVSEDKVSFTDVALSFLDSLNMDFQLKAL